MNTIRKALKEAQPTLGGYRRRCVSIPTATGRARFMELSVEAPEEWSDNAVAIATLLYMDAKQDRSSVYRMVDRLQRSFAADGIRAGYWTQKNSAQRASAISGMLLKQHFAFSSPIWMNYGRKPRKPLASCYIYPIEDSLKSIIEAIKTGVEIFASGGGCGYNMSRIRSAKEFFGTGPRAPGPVKFMRAIGSVSRTILSGGRDRNSSVVFVIDDTHPDVIEFCRAKSSGNESLPPNCISTIRLSRRFLSCVEKGQYDLRWPLASRASTSRGCELTVGKLWGAIVDEILKTGEPGIHFVDNISRGHTCPSSGEIRASNPCGEFLFLDDTAAILASINLSRFVVDEAHFAVEQFCETIAVVVEALNIAMDSTVFPSRQIGRQTKKFRPILLGFSDLAGALFRMRLSYSSKQALELCSAISALLTAQAYLVSSQLAQKTGPFPTWRENSDAMLRVVRRQLRATRNISSETKIVREIRVRAISTFTKAIATASRYGFKNAQVTAIAPTGTTSIVMDCDANGIEPRLAFRACRHLQSGGVIGIGPAGKNGENAIAEVLRTAGYSKETARAVLRQIQNGGSIKRLIRRADYGLFECALNSPTDRIVSPESHVAMTAAAAPFITGGISKTILISHGAKLSRKAVRRLVLDSWKKGIKGITIYRAGSNVEEPIR